MSLAVGSGDYEVVCHKDLCLGRSCSCYLSCWSQSKVTWRCLQWTQRCEEESKQWDYEEDSKQWDMAIHSKMISVRLLTGPRNGCWDSAVKNCKFMHVDTIWVMQSIQEEQDLGLVRSDLRPSTQCVRMMSWAGKSCSQSKKRDT